MTEDPITRYEFVMLKDNLEGQLSEIKGSLQAIWNKMDGRPSWTVTIMITILSSACLSLLVLLLKG